MNGDKSPYYKPYARGSTFIARSGSPVYAQSGMRNGITANYTGWQLKSMASHYKSIGLLVCGLLGLMD